MLADLKVLEDKLYTPDALATFLNKYKVIEVIKQLNKATKKETRDRVRYFFSKLAQSPSYKQFFMSCLSEEKEQKSEFIKYVSSEHSEQFFAMLQSKPDDVLHIIEHNQQMIPVLTRLIGYQYGIKLIKLFRKLYQEKADKFQCLFNPAIRAGLAEGLGFVEGESQLQAVDTEAQMRYLEIVVQIAILGGKCFDFVGDLLNSALGLYNTEDILLKMAMVQEISVLGESPQTSKLLRDHKIWKLVQKDACDPDQQFQVKKFLLILLVDMNHSGNYQMSQKVIKHIHEFLLLNLKEKGQYLQAAIDIISHLFQSAEGSKIVVQNIDVFSAYIALSRATFDSIKKPYYQSLANLTFTGAGSSKQAKEHPKYKMCINILNCIGKPNLISQLNHNMHANNYLTYGLEQFCKWYSKLLLLPFEETELVLIEIFQNILNYYQVAQTLLQIQDVSKYLLKTVIPNDTNKTLRAAKARLISTIIHKGRTDWQGQELSQYSRNLQKLMEGQKAESVYALGVE